MNITPERAKALSGIVREYGIHNLTSHEEVEIGAIVHHYAEILQKWQAVLDAEPVAYKAEIRHDWTVFVSRDSALAYIGDREGVITPLVIKPAP